MLWDPKRFPTMTYETWQEFAPDIALPAMAGERYRVALRVGDAHCEWEIV